jgi:hypothetical protein
MEATEVARLQAGTPMPLDLYLRQSTIESMKLCPARVGQAKEEGFLGTPSEAMAFGSLVHEIIAEFMLGDTSVYPLWASSPPHYITVLRGIAEKDGYDLDTVASPELQERMADEAIIAFRTWHGEVWEGHGLDRAEFVAIEKPMQRLLGVIQGRPVWFHGTPDVILSDEAVDWKTAGRGWSTNKEGQSKGMVSIQAPMYLWLSELEVGTLLDRFVFWVFDRSAGSWQQHLTEWSAEAVQAALENAFEYAKMVDAGAYPYTPGTDDFGKPKRGWHCSPKYCGAWNICKGKASLTDGSDLSIMAEETAWG